MTTMAGIESRADRGVREYITFRIGTQYFCVDIMSVREIRGWTRATALPHAPGFVRGVINLRGIVLPIVDLADRLGLPPAAPTARHVIIVAQTARQIIGLLVDAVSDIIAQPAESVQATPEIGSDASGAFVLGVLAMEDRMVSLIALDNLMPNLVGAAA
jgi:purine-binding chemotaxis protein CheW